MLAVGDPERCGHSVTVKRRVEDHDGAVNSAAEEVLSKLLDGGPGKDRQSESFSFQKCIFGEYSSVKKAPTDLRHNSSQQDKGDID